MSRYPVFIRWLVIAGLVDWLVGRTLMRSAIFMPKSPPVILVYQGLGLFGQLAATLTALLALGALGWFAWRWLSAGEGLGLPIAALSLPILSLLFLFVLPAGWLAVLYHLIFIALVAMLGRRAWVGLDSLKERIAVLVPVLALLVVGLYQLIPALLEALQWPGPPPTTMVLFNLGELLAVLSPFGLWWAYGQGASWKIWLAAALPALVFIAFRLANPALEGIIAIWSTGLTLYLPWPVYALSLWLAVVTVIAARLRGEAVGWAILLWMAGGYTPQLSTQAFLGLIGLCLLLPPFSRPAGFRHAQSVRPPIPGQIAS